MAGTGPKQEQQSRANAVSRAAGLPLTAARAKGRFFALLGWLDVRRVLFF